MARLLAYADDPDSEDGAEIARLLAADAGLRADFARLAARGALARMAPPAAASAGAVRRRQGNGYALRIEPSHADPDGLYLLVDLPSDDAVRPHVLVLLPVGRAPIVVTLPTEGQGPLQMTIGADSPLVECFGSVDCEAVLR